MAGVETGDCITAVDERAITDWLGLKNALVEAGASVDLTLDDGRRVTMQRSDWRPIVPPFGRWSRSRGLVPTLFVGCGTDPAEGQHRSFRGCRPVATQTKSPAHRAGLQAGDRFLSIDDQPIRVWGDVLMGFDPP